MNRIVNILYRIIYVEFLLRMIMKKLGSKNMIFRPLKFTPRYLTIGNNCYIFKNSRIEGISNYEGVNYQPEIILGNNVSIQQNLHLTCANRIVLSDFVAIGANVTITDIEHPYENINVPIEKSVLKVKEVFIGRETKIYNNAVILPGTILGIHSVVGANSIVSGEYPDYCIIVGVPARIVKRYCTTRGAWLKTNANGVFI